VQRRSKSKKKRGKKRVSPSPRRRKGERKKVAFRKGRNRLEFGPSLLVEGGRRPTLNALIKKDWK